MRLEGKSRADREAREVLGNEREEKRRRNPVVILAVYRAWDTDARMEEIL